MEELNTRAPMLSEPSFSSNFECPFIFFTATLCPCSDRHLSLTQTELLTCLKLHTRLSTLLNLSLIRYPLYILRYHATTCFILFRAACQQLRQLKHSVALRPLALVLCQRVD